MVKDLKVLRQRRTEGGCFSEFLIAKTPDDVENCAPALRASRHSNQMHQQINITSASSQSASSSAIDSSRLLPIGRSLPASSTAAAAAVAAFAASSSQSHRSEFVGDSTRRAKRRERNRVAAAKCRKKRQDQMDELSEICQQLEQSNSTLQQQVQELANEKDSLMQLLRDHEADCTDGLELPNFSLDGDSSCVGADPLLLSDEDSSMQQLLFSPTPMVSCAAESPPPADWRQATVATRPGDLLLLPSGSTQGPTIVTPLSALLTPQPFVKLEPSI